MNGCYVLRSQTSCAQFDSAKFYFEYFSRTVSGEACQPLICADRFLIGTSVFD